MFKVLFYFLSASLYYLSFIILPYKRFVTKKIDGLIFYTCWFTLIGIIFIEYNGHSTAIVDFLKTDLAYNLIIMANIISAILLFLFGSGGL